MKVYVYCCWLLKAGQSSRDSSIVITGIWGWGMASWCVNQLDNHPSNVIENCVGQLLRKTFVVQWMDDLHWEKKNLITNPVLDFFSYMLWFCEWNVIFTHKYNFSHVKVSNYTHDFLIIVIIFFRNNDCKL